MIFTCDTCQCPVTLDEGFFRSVSLRPVAWCRPCWFARRGLPLPTQRQAPADESPSPKERRRAGLTRR
jgi:hypothetical protein